MDAVCSVASEEIRFDDWEIDIVLTASQKGLGTPPGLSIVVASQRAIKVHFSYPFKVLCIFPQLLDRYSKPARRQYDHTTGVGTSNEPSLSQRPGN